VGATVEPRWNRAVTSSPFDLSRGTEARVCVGRTLDGSDVHAACQLCVTDALATHAPALKEPYALCAAIVEGDDSADQRSTRRQVCTDSIATTLTAQVGQDSRPACKRSSDTSPDQHARV
jgi:hypothetical protein